MNARVYDPGIGRFVSVDSFMGWLEEPASLNRYAYAYNNPVKHADLTGNDIYFTGHDLFSIPGVGRVSHGAWLIIPNDQKWAANDRHFRLGNAEDGITAGKYYLVISAGPEFAGFNVLRSGLFRDTDAPNKNAIYDVFIPPKNVTDTEAAKRFIAAYESYNERAPYDFIRFTPSSLGLRTYP